MIGISTEHFTDGMQLSNHEKTVNRVYRGLRRILKEKGYAIMYINGASFYIKPLSNNSMGFGSGELEIIFYETDNETTVKKKLADYFSRGYSYIIGYGGRAYTKEIRQKVEKYCSW